MNKIIFPLQRQTQGSRVNYLQEPLRLFLERGHMLRNDEGACQKLLVALPPERNSPHGLYKIVGNAMNSIANSVAIESKPPGAE